MKKTLLLVLATMFATATFAQQQLATLDHNDTISVYYGPTALTSAYNAAADGDIITLSSGTFSSPGEINKAITIRGAGMYADTVAGTLPTTITGNINILKDGTPTSHVTLEGIKFDGEMLFGGTVSNAYNNINYLYVSKCLINYFHGNAMYSCYKYLNNAFFTNCVIKRITVYNCYSGYNYSCRIQYSNFINCAILQMEGDNTTGLFNTLTNCVAHCGVGNAGNFTINSSILYDEGGANYSSSSLVNNSIGVNQSDGQNYFDTTITAGQNLHNYNSLTDVFVDFDGTYHYGSTTFKLKNNVAATALGSDGTQVGIYGGDVPFDPSVRNSMIGKLNVARRTNAQGKLEVNVDITEE